MGRTNYMDSLPKFRCDGVSFRRGLCSIMQPYFHQIKFWERPWQNVHLSQGASIARYRSPFGRAAFNRQLTQEYGSKLKPFHCRQISMKVTGKQSNVKETVIPEPDFRIPIVFSGLAGSLIYNGNLVIAAPIGLLGLLLFFQATRVRFVFDDEALEVRVGAELKESGENVFVGGKNRWKYSTFVNWELWWPNFPVLVYFKEIQTKPEGQIHFFPVIFNGKQLYEVMIERAGPSKNSGRK